MRSANRVVSITGELDMAEVGGLERGLEGASHDHDHRLVIDLSGCKYVDSSGLSALIRCVDSPSRRGLPAVVVCPRANPVRRILDLVAFDRAVPVSDSLDQALV